MKRLFISMALLVGLSSCSNQEKDLEIQSKLRKIREMQQEQINLMEREKEALLESARLQEEVRYWRKECLRMDKEALSLILRLSLCERSKLKHD